MDASGNVTILHSFADSDGAVPYGGLVQGADGNLYGTTSLGGAGDSGVIFRVSTSGSKPSVSVQSSSMKKLDKGHAPQPSWDVKRNVLGRRSLSALFQLILQQMSLVLVSLVV